MSKAHVGAPWIWLHSLALGLVVGTVLTAVWSAFNG